MTNLLEKDMVVLNRNNSSDANVCQGGEITCLYDLYLTSSNDLYFYHCGKNKWILSNLSGDEDYYKLLKPIEKKEMKEFLVSHDNKWTLQLLDSDTEENNYRVAVPSGANTCIDKYFFYKDCNTALTDQGWMDCDKSCLKTVESMVKTGGRIIWQRHKQPKELPLIDDEPKPDTPMAYMEREFERDQCMENARREGLLGDPRIGAPHNPCDEPRIDTYKSEFGVEPTISLNNQYAEIEKARQATKETEYLMQGKNGEKLMESLAQFHNTDRGADFDNFELLEESKPHSHYFIDVSDVDEVDFYEIALRYNVTDPCIQHILKKCLAVGNRGHKDLHTDIKDIYDTAKRALNIHGLD